MPARDRFLLLTLVLCSATIAGAQNFITTFAGTDYLFPANGKPAIQAPLGEAYGLATDSRGNVYIPDQRNDMVFRLSPEGIIEIFAGNGFAGFSGDGGQARNASFNNPTGAVVDARGNVYITDGANQRIRRVSPDGIVTTVAGNGNATFTGDGPALQAALGSVRSPALDSAGNLYFHSYEAARIFVLTPAGQIRTIAGNGRNGLSPDGTSATQASLAPFVDLAVDPTGKIFLAEPSYNRIRIIDQGALRTIAGNGLTGDPSPNVSATGTALTNPGPIALDSQGNLYISVEAQLVRLTNDRLTIIAGDGEYDYRGDGGRAISASLSAPLGMTVDARNNLYFSDELCLCVRVINAAGIINTVAGNAALWRPADGIPATRAYLRQPFGLAFNSAGNMLVAITGLALVGSVTPSGIYTTIAGSLIGYRGDGGPAKNALLDSPAGIAFDPRNNRTYIADRGTNIIRMIDAAGNISTFAGTQYKGGYGGDNGPARSAVLWRPNGLAVDSSGNLYIADSRNHRVRVVSTDGTIRTYAGDGQDRYAGDGRAPAQASLREPVALAFTTKGELLIADISDNRIRIVGADGLMNTFAGTGAPGPAGDGGPATRAAFYEPSGLATDAAGNVYVLQAGGNRLRKIDASGNVTLLAGTGAEGFSGDGGSSLTATLRTPMVGLAVNRDGDVFFSDSANGRVRVIRAAAPRLNLDQTTLSLTVPAGETSKPQPLLVRSDRSGVRYDFSATAPEWLRIVPHSASSTSEVQLDVIADATNLDPGSYQATVTVQSSVSAPRSATVSVALTVTPSRPPKLSLPSTSLTLEAIVGEKYTQTLSVANAGGGTLNFTAKVASDSPWLTVDPQQASASADSSANLNVTASAEGLAPGTYSASLTITGPDDEVRVPITFAAHERPRPRLLISQSGLSFDAVAKGGTPSPQSIGVLNEGAGEMTWTAKATTLGGGDWLSLGAASGRVDRPLLDVSLLDVRIQPAGLAAGDYYGRIDISAASDNSPQIVTVILHMLPEGSNPGPEVRPAGLIFTGLTGLNPGSQAITVTNLLGQQVQYVSSRLTFSEDTFTHSPSQSTVAPDSPVQIVVQPDYRNLAPGVRQGLLTLFFDDGKSRSVNVLTVVSPAGQAGTRNLTGCASPNLRIEYTSLRDGFVAIGGEPTTVEVKVVDDCGTLLTPQTTPNSAVVVYFSNGDPQLRLVHLGGGIWTGTWRPVRVIEGPVNIEANVFYLVGNNVKAFGQVRSGTLQATGKAPVVRPGSLRHSATFETEAPVAPGELISVLGSNLADREDRVDGFPLPFELGQTEVLLGARSLPLLFSNEGQINAQVPYDLPVNTQQQVVVRRGNTLSVPERFVVAPATPGIFTKNEQGFGQGAIFRSNGDRAEPGTPAGKGEEVIIFCTGLGDVEPRIAPGAAAPDPPPRVTGDVSVTIGGLAAEVRFAGLTPGVAGRYQVRVVIPDGVPASDEVPVVVKAAGRESRPVTMAIR